MSTIDALISLLEKKLHEMDVQNESSLSLTENELDQDLVDELVLFAVNDANIYRQRVQPIMKNLQRKIEKGVYDPELAVRAFAYAAQDAWKAYNKEFSGPGGIQLPRGQLKPTLMAVGRELLNHYSEEMGLEEAS